MNLLEQLQNPKLWSVVIGLLVSVGLIEFTDAQVAEIVGALTALFTALGTIAMAVLAQKGDNDANKELAHNLQVQERSLGDNDFILVHDRLRRIEERVASLERMQREGGPYG